jgi:serine/threonine protein kinase
MPPENAPPQRFRPRKGAEPAQGYLLARKLGGGGYGEVWEAQAPGGFRVALKFVRLSESNSETEVRSLEYLKAIRHPNLLTIFAAWRIDDYLTIAMEFADGTLWDRFQQLEKEGQKGIPVSEIMEYFAEAAKGIDYLNEPKHTIGGKDKVSIQHRDIKPQNIMIVGNGVKVADFGLARLMEHTVAAHTGGMTPSYAAPEFFNGQTHQLSDQYSLAVTYCHLRGGRLPFTGGMAKVMAGHLTQKPDLSMVPEHERPVIERALAKQPSERWPNCRKFIEMLRSAGRMSGMIDDADFVPFQPLIAVPAPRTESLLEAKFRPESMLDPHAVDDEIAEDDEISLGRPRRMADDSAANLQPLNQPAAAPPTKKPEPDTDANPPGTVQSTPRTDPQPSSRPGRRPTSDVRGFQEPTPSNWDNLDARPASSAANSTRMPLPQERRQQMREPAVPPPPPVPDNSSKVSGKRFAVDPNPRSSGDNPALSRPRQVPEGTAPMRSGAHPAEGSAPRSGMHSAARPAVRKPQGLSVGMQVLVALSLGIPFIAAIVVALLAYERFSASTSTEPETTATTPQPATTPEPATTPQPVVPVVKEPAGQIAIYRPVDKQLASVAFTADDDYVLSADATGKLHYWPWRHPERVLVLPGVRHGQQLAFPIGDQSVRALAVGPAPMTGDEPAAVLVDLNNEGTRKAVSGWMPNQAVSRSADASTVISGSGDGSVYLWDARTNDLAFIGERYVGLTTAVRVVGLSVDGQQLLATGTDGTACIWDAINPKQPLRKWSLTGPKQFALFSGDARSVLTAGTDSGSNKHEMLVWQEGNEVLRLQFSQPITSITALPRSASVVVLGHPDGSVLVYNFQAKTTVARFEGHTGPVVSLASDRTGQRVASASTDGTVRVWTTTGKP